MKSLYEKCHKKNVCDKIQEQSDWYDMCLEKDFQISLKVGQLFDLIFVFQNKRKKKKITFYKNLNIVIPPFGIIINWTNTE